MCAALTTDGYLAAWAIEGSYDVDEFYDFITEDVVSFSLCSVTLDLLYYIASPHESFSSTTLGSGAQQLPDPP